MAAVFLGLAVSGGAVAYAETPGVPDADARQAIAEHRAILDLAEKELDDRAAAAAAAGGAPTAQPSTQPEPITEPTAPPAMPQPTATSTSAPAADAADFDVLAYHKSGGWKHKSDGGKVGRTSTTATLSTVALPLYVDVARTFDNVRLLPGDASTVLFARNGSVTARESLVEETVKRIDGRNDVEVVVEHSDLSGRGQAVTGQGVTVRYSDVGMGSPEMNDGVNPTSARTGGLVGTERGTHPASLIEYNRMVSQDAEPGTKHADALQMWDGHDVTVRRNYIDWTHAGVIAKTDFGTISHVRIEDNYFTHTGNPAEVTKAIQIRVGKSSFGQPQYVTITGNVFGGNYYGRQPVNGGASNADEPPYVRTEAERTAAVRDGATFTTRGSSVIAPRTIPAAAWIVYDGNRWDDGSVASPPNGWHTYANGKLTAG